jgi:hypothetical protein
MSAYRAWREKYDVSYFKDISISINIFLKHHGYVLFEQKDMAQSLEHFCWAHEWIINHEPKKHIVYPKPMHDGIEDDYEWYCETIQTDDWLVLFNTIQEDGVFDDSREGLSMQYALPKFIWLKMNLNESRTYRKYAAMRDNYNDDDWEENDYVHED